MVKIPSFKKIWKDYVNYHKELLEDYKFKEKIKMMFSIIFLVLAMGFYGYFVNISSTKWYFIKIQREKLAEVKFQNEIVKIDTRKIEWEILQNVVPFNIVDTDNLNGKVLTIRENAVKSVALLK